MCALIMIVYQNLRAHLFAILLDALCHVSLLARVAVYLNKFE
jgi:hypothetical protein